MHMSLILLYLIIGLLIADFIFERILEFLNSTRWSDVLPVEVRDIYDEEKYRQQQNYEKVNFRFSLISSSFSFVVMLLMFLFGGFAWVNGLALAVSANPILTALLFFGILMLASDLLNTPFSVYDTFVIEEKFGFNKTTPKTFVLDKLKGYLLGSIIGGGILSMIIYIYQLTTSDFWIFRWLVLFGF